MMLKIREECQIIKSVQNDREESKHTQKVRLVKKLWAAFPSEARESELVSIAKI